MCITLPKLTQIFLKKYIFFFSMQPHLQLKKLKHERKFQDKQLNFKPPKLFHSFKYRISYNYNMN